MAIGTNINSAVQPTNTTLWIREIEPNPSSSNDQQLAISAACLGSPPTTANVFKHGCLMLQFDTATGTSAQYENTGSAASPVWNLVGNTVPGDITLTNTHILVGNASNVGADVAASGDLTLANTGAFTIANNAVTTAKILNANVTLAKLAAGITPSHVVKFAGTSPAFGGGGVTDAITVTGAAATDVATAVIRTSTNAVSIAKAVLTANTLTITYSADPGAGTTVDYSILRAAV